MASTRSVTSPGIFAEDATTTIPPTPIQGVSYRDPVAGPASAADGWPYFEKVNSAEFNQLMYQYSTLLETLDKRGTLGWTDQIDYTVPALVYGSNGLLYLALQASGPSSTPRDPTSEPAYWEQLASHGMIVFSSAGVTVWPVPLAMQLGIIKPKVTVIGGGAGGARRTANPGAQGGSEGGTTIGVVDLTGVTSVTITVGAKGIGGATDPSDGTAGGSSSFGAFLSATGGQPGSGGNVGNPGVGSGGAINLNGGHGSPAMQGAASLLGGFGGGASSPFSANGTQITTIPGHGGGGRTGVAGRDGADGAVTIEW